MSKKHKQERKMQTAPTEAPAVATPAMGAVTEPAKPAKDPELFMLGKKYVPKTERNSETWGKITKLLAEGPKTLKDISEAIKGHGDFLGYMRRGGHVIPFVAE